MRYNKIRFFHGVIVAFLLLGVYGCGYKSAPKHKERKIEKAELGLFLFEISV